ncbi:Uncharacterised protein [Chryseobacterium nakagawai]|uniref:Phage tail protein n=1 Tax=Chryseobacterium nakagawai TaxID=1241982 RepID=A0AAD0YMF8_CHRNA|nr:hypothetical protein [Chryseobacterium nakagawai]AZA91123.1 hypothetical protein EG343_11030 [Chryseobacterium nakagawai]VEH22683.1 Uncharacterised protein [Chryseobacterium nakagawai]
MNEVKYVLNGHSFKDFNVFVTDSPGITDGLERKPVQTYDWAEYHGTSPDLRKPKYKERKFTLKCFIDADNWENLFEVFKDFIREQFSKPGTQRLHITPFDEETLPYEVYVQEDIKLDKKFRQGRMVGTFDLVLIEPNPIKRVLKTTLDTFKLSYEINSETEIFFGDGTKQTGRGNVSLTKDYSKPSYENSGVSIIGPSGVNDQIYEVYSVPSVSSDFQFSVEITLSAAIDVILYVIGRNLDNTYELAAKSVIHNASTGKNIITTVQELNMDDYGKFIFKILDSSGDEIPGRILSNPRIETAEVVGEWQNMLGKEKIIIIAGNIEDVNNIQTPAETIWEKI